MSQMDVDIENLSDLLPLYYKRIFPYSHFYAWLSYSGDKEYFSRRELCFTLLDDVYIRYQSFDDPKELIKQIQKQNPIKIDIGAIYNEKPSQRSGVSCMVPIEKELVFDIDMTDYDEIRTCCTGAAVCKKCWKYMTVACKILDVALREDFDFKHLLFVFSGRRGIHLWVCDEEARKMNEIIRDSIVSYLNLIGKKKLHIYGESIHISLARALKIVDQYFVEIVFNDQDMLGTKERVSKFLSVIEDKELRKNFEETMMKEKTSEERWNKFNSHFEYLFQKGKIPPFLRHLREEIKIQYTYPRLDVAVSVGLNHLLKAPFCVHPKTGKVCIPFSIRMVGKFDPNTVPTINELVAKINAYDAETIKQEEEIQEQEEKVEDNNYNISKVMDYKKTTLLKPVNTFEEFLKGMGIKIEKVTKRK